MKLLSRFISPIMFLLIAGAAMAADFNPAIDEILRRGDAAAASYDPSNRLAAATEFSSLYFDVFETSGLEMDLGVRDPGLKTNLEVLFGALNAKAMRGAPADDVRAGWSRVSAALGEARKLYGGERVEGFWSVFVKSLLILLREGAEAMLVIGALAAYLRRAGAADRVWVLYAGAGIAVPLSLLTGWLLNRSMRLNGISAGMIEAVSLLAAAGILVYISFWLFSKREARRWQAWVAGRMECALSGGSLLALGGAACLAVYREGAETVLFYAALAASAPGHETALASGIAMAAVALAALYFGLRRFAMRIPLRAFFSATAALLYAMAVIFAGQALIELQATGYLPSHYLPGFPSIAWAGVAPTLQGLGTQGMMLMLPSAVWLWTRRARPTAR
ncbi:MAG: FTR1 family iron permease [Sulfuricella sp.]|nr:FTR1 family iron permease [Sulfuricella sp.]